MIVHDSWWSNGNARSTIIDYHEPFDQGLNLSIKWHSPRPWLFRFGEPKRLYEEKLSRLPGLPYLPRWDNSPTRDELAILIQTLGWILQRNKLKVTSAKIIREEGCLRYPRPNEWGHRLGIEISWHVSRCVANPRVKVISLRLRV